MRRIVVGVDGSETASAALRWAAAEAEVHGATIVAVHAWHDVYLGGAYPAASTMLVPSLYRDAAQGVLDAAVDLEEGVEPQVTFERVLVHGSPTHALLEAAKGADMIVVGSRGRGGFGGLLLGSVSQQVVHHAPCPVVVIPVSG